MQAEKYRPNWSWAGLRSSGCPARSARIVLIELGVDAPGRLILWNRIFSDPAAARVLVEILAGINARIHRLDIEPRGVRQLGERARGWQALSCALGARRLGAKPRTHEAGGKTQGRKTELRKADIQNAHAHRLLPSPSDPIRAATRQRPEPRGPSEARAVRGLAQAETPHRPSARGQTTTRRRAGLLTGRRASRSRAPRRNPPARAPGDHSRTQPGRARSS